MTYESILTCCFHARSLSSCHLHVSKTDLRMRDLDEVISDRDPCISFKTLPPDSAQIGIKMHGFYDLYDCIIIKAKA